MFATRLIAGIALVAMLAVGSIANAQTGSLTAGSASGVPGAAISVPVLLSNDTPLDGFSLGLAHDPAIVSVTALNLGSALDSTQGGIDPTVVLPNTAPAGGSGITIGLVLDLSPPFVQLPVGSDHEVLVVDYVIEATAAVGSSTTLEFVENLGLPAVETILVLDGGEAVPTLANGSVTVIQNQFLRGDCNQDGNTNLVDVVSCLRKLFGIDPASTCQRADDVNDNGILEVADASFLLQFLFNGGAPVPAPASGCGDDPTADGLTCDSHAFCP